MKKKNVKKEKKRNDDPIVKIAKFICKIIIALLYHKLIIEIFNTIITTIFR
jgi:hypothetical protein